MLRLAQVLVREPQRLLAAACELPQLEPRLLLQRLRGRTLWFWGDSLTRQQFDALLCQLAGEAEQKDQPGRTDYCDKSPECAPRARAPLFHLCRWPA